MRFAAILAHVLTALGAVCALFAFEAIRAQAWEGAFFWLGVALIVDGIDGPFARLVYVTERLPRFSGERLDLVIDYLTYVFIPAVALREAGFLQGIAGEVLAAAILVSSLYHFSDLKSKADDLNFVGFPAIWNIVAFYLFVFEADPATASAIVALCIALTFVPTKWVHPVRVQALRPLTLAVTLVWAVAALAVVMSGFATAPYWAKGALVLVALYALSLPVFYPRFGARS